MPMAHRAPPAARSHESEAADHTWPAIELSGPATRSCAGSLRRHSRHVHRQHEQRQLHGLQAGDDRPQGSWVGRWIKNDLRRGIVGRQSLFFPARQQQTRRCQRGQLAKLHPPQRLALPIEQRLVRAHARRLPSCQQRRRKREYGTFGSRPASMLQKGTRISRPRNCKRPSQNSKNSKIKIQGRIQSIKAQGVLMK